MLLHDKRPGLWRPLPGFLDQERAELAHPFSVCRALVQRRLTVPAQRKPRAVRLRTIAHGLENTADRARRGCDSSSTVVVSLRTWKGNRRIRSGRHEARRRPRRARKRRRAEAQLTRIEANGAPRRASATGTAASAAPTASARSGRSRPPSSCCVRPTRTWTQAGGWPTSPWYGRAKARAGQALGETAELHRAKGDAPAASSVRKLEVKLGTPLAAYSRM
jgi:hypothetical protein